jgi:DNA invertase Pin-like site-specific DNA recombinase
MKVIGYARISTDKQDLAKQKHLLLEYAQAQQLLVHEFIEIEISSQKDTKARRIDELQAKLQSGDLLLVTELSQLGRNMLETLNIIHELRESGVNMVFVRQPELSTTGPHAKLLLAIYSYFAEAEREYISLRTRQGLAAVRARGTKLGRLQGSRNRGRALDPYRDQIRDYLQKGLPLASVRKIVNHQLERPLSYTSFRYFVQQDVDLCHLWNVSKEGVSGRE